MKIRGWQIDGFGHFCDHGENGLPDGITVFLGPNEAGKSTLLAFLRGMLFGFPSGRQNRYEPVHSRHMGGKLSIDSPQGTYTIQRNGDRKEGFRLFRPDDTQGGEAELAQLLGHADQRLFNSVFAFSLSELRNFEVHKEAGIKDRIFAGSLQGGRNTAREALVQLDKENAPIFKVRRREVELVKLSQRLGDLRAEIQEARNRALDYERLVAREESLHGMLGRLSQEQAALQRQIQRQELLLGVWPKWLNRQSLARELESLDVVDHFPSQAEARLAESLSAAKRLEAMLSELHLEQRTISQRLTELNDDPRLEALSERIPSLAGDVPRFLDWLQALAENSEQRLQAQNELEAMLATLGKSWTRERLKAFDASIPALEVVLRWEKLLNAAATASSEAARDVKEAQQRVESVRSAVNAQQQRLAQLGEALPSSHLAEQEQRLLRLRTNYALHREGLAEQRQLESKLRALEIDFQRLPTGEPLPLPRGLRWGLWAIALMLLVLGFWKGLTQDMITTMGLLAAALALASLSVVKSRANGSEPQARALIAAQLRETQACHDDLESRIEALGATLREDGMGTALGGQPSPAEIEAFAQELATERERTRQHAELSLALERLLAEEADAISRCEHAMRSRTVAEEDAARHEADWGNWRRASGIDETHSPRSVVMLFQALASARQFMATLTALEASGDALIQKVDDFRREAHALLADAGEAVPSGDTSLMQAISRLEDRLRSDLEAREARDTLSRESRGLALKIETKEAELAAVRQALGELYAEAGAEDEASFHHRRAVHAQRQNLRRSLQELDRHLDEQLGRDAQAEALKTVLQSENVESWRQAVTEATIALEALSEERDETNRALGEVRKAQGEIAEASEVITREHAYQAMRDEFQRQSRAWLVRALAEDMIQETLTEVERTRQPAVLLQAAHLFGQVTDERYVRLIQQSGDFLVVDQHENRMEVEKLSQGTAEQLYLCLRLGLIQEFARQSTNLPLIMDDVFVNFDPERARRVAELLVGFSSNHQVLLFTCHPQTAELLREVQPNVRIVTMPRYGGYSSPRLDRRASMSQREPSEDPREVILACLQASEEAIGKTEILRRTGLGDGAWGAAIATLKAEGVVEQQGEKRGAVYRRVTAMSQNKEVFTDAAVLD